MKLKDIPDVRDLNDAAALVTVVETSGSTPRKAGARMVVVADGSTHGRLIDTIGGGAIEHKVRAVALEVAKDMRPRLESFSLTTELGMCCGGSMTLFFEPLRSNPPLCVLGAGHIGGSVARLAATVGFDVTVADPREELLQSFDSVPQSSISTVDGYDKADLDGLPFGPDCFCLIVTHDHGTDQRLTEDILKRQTRHLTVIGSQRKAILTRDRCLAKGFSQNEVERIHSPAGFQIGAETPEEIAVSIVAELIAVRRGAVASENSTVTPLVSLYPRQ